MMKIMLRAKEGKKNSAYLSLQPITLIFDYEAYCIYSTLQKFLSHIKKCNKANMSSDIMNEKSAIKSRKSVNSSKLHKVDISTLGS